MNTFSLSNIPLKTFRRFLYELGGKPVSVRGGHEKWSIEGCSRCIIIQTHIDPVAMPVINSALRDLGLSRKEFIKIIQGL